MRRWTPVLALVPAVVLLAACSSTASIPKAEVEQQAITELTAVVGQAPDSLSCPGDLVAEVGTTMKCELTSDGTTLGVTITVTAVEGDVADFDIVVDDAPTE